MAVWPASSATEKPLFEEFQVAHLHCLDVPPLWFLPDFLLEVVIGFCLLGADTGGLVATVVACRVGLVHHGTILLTIKRYQDHACQTKWE